MWSCTRVHFEKLMEQLLMFTVSSSYVSTYCGFTTPVQLDLFNFWCYYTCKSKLELLLAEHGNLEYTQSAKHTSVLYTPAHGVVYQSNFSITFAPMYMWKNGIGRFYASMCMRPHLPHEILSLAGADLLSVLFSGNVTLVLGKVLL